MVEHVGRRDPEEGEPAEPTESQTRSRASDELAPLTAPRSVRPSAFGLPRPSSPPAPRESAAPPPAAARVQSPPARRADTGRQAPNEREKSVGGGSRARAAAPSSGEWQEHDARSATALPRLAQQRTRTLPQLTADSSNLGTVVAGRSGAAERALTSGHAALAPHAKPAPIARRPWTSIAMFCGMLALSSVPLLRYARTQEGAVEPAAQPATSSPDVREDHAARAAEQQVAQAHEAERRVEVDTAAERERLLSSLIIAGNRSLVADDIGEAERLFGRVIELNEDNPRAAFGLARIRLAQGNLSGAEGWIQLALRRRPRREQYHALYAEILQRLGRVQESREEQRAAGEAPISGED